MLSWSLPYYPTWIVSSSFTPFCRREKVWSKNNLHMNFCSSVHSPVPECDKEIAKRSSAMNLLFHWVIYTKFLRSYKTLCFILTGRATKFRTASLKYHRGYLFSESWAKGEKKAQPIYKWSTHFDPGNSYCVSFPLNTQKQKITGYWGHLFSLF